MSKIRLDVDAIEVLSFPVVSPAPGSLAGVGAEPRWNDQDPGTGPTAALSIYSGVDPYYATCDPAWCSGC